LGPSSAVPPSPPAGIPRHPPLGAPKRVAQFPTAPSPAFPPPKACERPYPPVSVKDYVKKPATSPNQPRFFFPFGPSPQFFPPQRNRWRPVAFSPGRCLRAAAFWLASCLLGDVPSKGPSIPRRFQRGIRPSAFFPEGGPTTQPLFFFATDNVPPPPLRLRQFPGFPPRRLGGRRPPTAPKAPSRGQWPAPDRTSSGFFSHPYPRTRTNRIPGPRLKGYKTPWPERRAISEPSRTGSNNFLPMRGPPLSTANRPPPAWSFLPS